MNTDKKPVDATTAVAKEPLEVTEKDVNEANTLIAEEHYVGKDGDRLFTRDEVSIILRKRIERHDRALLAKYHLSSMQELDELVRFAHDVESLFEHHSKKQAELNPKKTTSGKEVLGFIGDKEKVTIQEISENLNLDYEYAENIVSILEEIGVLVVLNFGPKPRVYNVCKPKLLTCIAIMSFNC